METVSRLVFKKSDFKNKDDMYRTLSEQSRILAENGYAIVMYSSVGPDDYMIMEFSSLKPEIGGMMPFWLDFEESKYLLKYQREQEYARCQYTVDNKDKIEETMKAFEQTGKFPQEEKPSDGKASGGSGGDGGDHSA